VTPAWQVVARAFLGLFALLSAAERLSDHEGASDYFFGVLGVVVGVHFIAQVVVDVRRRLQGDAASTQGEVEERRGSLDAARSMTRERIQGLVQEHQVDVSVPGSRIAVIKLVRHVDPRLSLIEAKTAVDDWFAGSSTD
jgi:ribosomal protein L7/L12